MFPAQDYLQPLFDLCHVIGSVFKIFLFPFFFLSLLLVQARVNFFDAGITYIYSKV